MTPPPSITAAASPVLPDAWPGSSNAITALALADAARQRLPPGSLAVLVCVASGVDSIAAIHHATGLAPHSIRVAVRRLSGRGRYCRSAGGPVLGLADPLVHCRPHPHEPVPAIQIRPSPAGIALASRLMGTPPPSADESQL